MQQETISSINKEGELLAKIISWISWLSSANDSGLMRCILSGGGIMNFLPKTKIMQIEIGKFLKRHFEEQNLDKKRTMATRDQSPP